MRILGGVQLIVDFDAAEICCLHVTTTEAMSFTDKTPSISFDDFKDQYVLMFAFFST